MTTSQGAQAISRVLIANRGEIARRVIRTCEALGIETVAVFSSADRDSPYVDEATLAVALTGSSAGETYLDAAQLIDAARRSGADAVHPGYGFLAENADFAEAVGTAGLAWIGPTPGSMRSMALKIEAKRIAALAGVPLVPGVELDDAMSEDELLAAVAKVGYPLLVKASAGGGGKGMRVVRTPSELVESVSGARREAAAAFGDATVFVERYVERARHVEVQVFGDEQGDVVHLFERECSVQRRHQKIVEESPSPGATAATLAAMYDAALSLARAIGYVGAGTVEFLVSGSGREQEFFFLEMNTRLQVEHPVTEEVTGLDLVEWQIRVARGEPLPRTQDAIGRHGHAIEVRVYAEDPALGHLPGAGVVTAFDIDRIEGIRVEAGVERGSVVSAHYDPLLAKVIASGATRREAVYRLAGCLRRGRVDGVATNLASLVAILESAPFVAGDTTTALLAENPELLAPTVPPEVRRLHLLTAAIALLDRASGGDGPAAGWRNVSGVPEVASLRYRDGDRERTAVVARAWGREHPTYWICADAEHPVPAQTIATDVRFERVTAARLDDPQQSGAAGDGRGVEAVSAHPSSRLEVDRVRRAVRCDVEGEHVHVAIDGWSATYDLVAPWAGSSHSATAGAPAAPVPGTVTHVAVEVGDEVVAGTALVVLEAMKMEHTIRADVDGVVDTIHVQVGRSVDAHAVLVTLAPRGDGWEAP